MRRVPAAAQKALAEEIRSRRLAQQRGPNGAGRPWSQEYLADQLGTTRLVVLAWENAKHVPDDYWEEQIRETLGGPPPEAFTAARRSRGGGLSLAEAEKLREETQLLRERVETAERLLREIQARLR
jgi:transcriptional regulator with XRE-family HTH domain